MRRSSGNSAGSRRHWLTFSVAERAVQWQLQRWRPCLYAHCSTLSNRTQHWSQLHSAMNGTAGGVGEVRTKPACVLCVSACVRVCAFVCRLSWLTGCDYIMVFLRLFWRTLGYWAEIGSAWLLVLAGSSRILFIFRWGLVTELWHHK